MEIIEKLLTINPFSRSGEKQNKIEDIIVHWVRECKYDSNS